MEFDADNCVAAFEIEDAPVRGRIVRLGAVVDEILRRHNYPEAVANLLGEACVLSVLVGSALKFEGRLVLQAQGDGPVSYVVADYDSSGDLRGYARFDAEKVAALSSGEWARPGAQTLLGEGAFAMTIDQGPNMDSYQGVVPIEGETLALCAETFFEQSEQVPTRIRLAAVEHKSGEDNAAAWRAGGVMIQRIAGDETRGDTEEGWERACTLFATVGDDEMADDDLTADRLLFRLFHEDGVRMFEPSVVLSQCRCSRDRIYAMLASFPPEDLTDMTNDDGQIEVTCEFCSRSYNIRPDELK